MRWTQLDGICWCFGAFSKKHPLDAYVTEKIVHWIACAFLNHFLFELYLFLFRFCIRPFHPEIMIINVESFFFWHRLSIIIIVEYIIVTDLCTQAHLQIHTRVNCENLSIQCSGKEEHFACKIINREMNIVFKVCLSQKLKQKHHHLPNGSTNPYIHMYTSYRHNT